MRKFLKIAVFIILIIVIVPIFSQVVIGEKGLGETLEDIFNISGKNGQVEVVEGEYWVYVQAQDDIVKLEDIDGHTQRGDIVDVIPTSRGGGRYQRSKNFLLVLVSGLTKEEINQLKQPYEIQIGVDPETGEPTAKSLASRRYRLDLDALKSQNNITTEVGTYDTPINANTLPIVEKLEAEILSYQDKAMAFEKSQKYKNIAQKVKDFIIRPARAATTYTFYVDPDAEAGGDCTTNDLTGANAACQSLTILEDLRDTANASLTDTDDIEEWIVDSNGGSHTADGAAEINGFTTGANNYIYIHTPEDHRHNGTYDTTKYRMEATFTTTAQLLNVYDNYVWVEGIGFKMNVATNYISNKAVSFVPATGAKLDSCVVVVNHTDGSSTITYGVFTDGGNLKIYNSIIYCLSSYGSSDRGMLSQYADPEIYNSTISGFDYSITKNYTSNSVTIKNSAVFNNGDDFLSAGGTFTVDYCASDDGDGTNAVDFTSEATDWANIFTDYANGDFSLKNYVGDRKIIGMGTDDPGSDLYDDDIIGTARTSLWDIGAFEYVAAGGEEGSSATSSVKVKGETNVRGGVEIR